MSARIIEKPANALEGNSVDGGYDAEYTLRLQTGVTYRSMIFDTENLDDDQITEISLLHEGDQIVRVSGEDLQLIRTSTGEYMKDGVFVLPFTDTTQTAMDGQNWSELVTGVGENLILKIRTGARKAAQAGKIATVKMRYKFGPTRRVRSRMPRLHTDGLSGNTAGINNHDAIISMQRGGSKAWIQRIFLKNPAVEKLKVLAAGRIIFEKTLAENEFDLRSNGQQVPDGVYAFDSVSEGFSQFDAIADVAGVEYEITLSSTGAYQALLQYMQVLPQPVVVNPAVPA